MGTYSSKAEAVLAMKKMTGYKVEETYYDEYGNVLPGAQ